MCPKIFFVSRPYGILKIFQILRILFTKEIAVSAFSLNIIYYLCLKLDMSQNYDVPQRETASLQYRLHISHLPGSQYLFCLQSCISVRLGLLFCSFHSFVSFTIYAHLTAVFYHLFNPLRSNAFAEKPY